MKGVSVENGVNELRRAAALTSILLYAAGWVSGQSAVTTHHYDNTRTGADLTETALNTSNVNPQQFGMLFHWPVDASVYAQPLYVPSVAIPGKGTHNVVYIVTMNDSVYAFDADSNAGANSAPLWSVNYTNPTAGITAVPASDVQLADETDISGNIGIEGTPVINPGTSAMYFVARTKENGTYVQRLHAIDIRSGAELANSPSVIAASVTNSAGTLIPFDPKRQNQRVALTLANSLVYIVWASHNDIGPYHGWVMAFSPSTLQLSYVFNDTPDGGMGGIWQAGSGPTLDGAGNLYLGSGNGDWNGTTNFGQSVFKLSPQLTLLDYFTPDNWQVESGNDVDLGCGGLIVIPGTNLLVEGSKEGILYLLSTQNMGHMVSGNTQIPQIFQGAQGHVHSGPTYYNSPTLGPVIYIWSEDDYLKAYHFNGSTLDTTPVSQSTFKDPQGMAGGFSTLSANGTTLGTALLWESLPLNGDAAHAIVPGALRAFDANDLTKEVWDSHMAPDRDDVGNHAKDVPPLVANGKVYLATFSNQVNVYGLFATPASLSETLSTNNLTITAGGTGSLTASIAPGGSFAGIVYFAASGLPGGATAQFSPSTGNGAVPSSTSAVVTVGASVAPGSYPVTITATSGVFSAAQTFTLVVAPQTVPARLSSIFNLVGISNDAAPTYGNIDGGGSSLSSTLVPATLTAGGVAFSTGPTANGSKNVIAAGGQVVPVTSGFYGSINFLGLGVGGNQAGQFTITYADGTKTMVPISVSNWIGGPQYGETVALTMAYRNTAAGKQTGTYYLYAYALKADPTRQVTSVTFPSNNNLIVLAVTGVSAVQTPAALTAVYRLNSGGNAAGSFATDADYAGGNASTSGATIDLSAVSNPAPLAVYQAERWGPSTYSFTGLTAGSSYTVRLHFAEYYWSAPGQRVFNVLLNGTKVLSNFDIIARAGGASRALVEQFAVAADGTGTITVALQNGAFDQAKISGVEILTPTPTSTTTSLQISAGGKGTGSFVADQDYVGGNVATVTNAIDTSMALFPAPAAVYQSERWANATYTIPNLVSGNSYTVRLHFAETYWATAGKRIFNVLLNGNTVLPAFDIVAAAGSPNRAISEQFTTTATSNGQIVIQLQNGAADNAKIDGVEVFSTGPTGANANLAINAGGGASGAFLADQNFSGGTTATVTNAISTSGVTNPAPLSVYQTERWGVFSYNVAKLAPGTTHTIRLHFAESYWTATGQRQFSVTANGTTVLANFDIVKAAGGVNKAVVIQFITSADQNGQISLSFAKGSADNPKIDGIEVH